MKKETSKNGGRKYPGNHPQDGEGWEAFGQVEDCEGCWFALYRKAQGHSPDWITYKIVAVGVAPRKANYWLVRNRRTGQIGFARDFASMRANRPHLHGEVEAAIREIDG